MESLENYSQERNKQDNKLERLEKGRPSQQSGKSSRNLPLKSPFHRMLAEDQVGLPTANEAMGTLL